MGSSKLMSLSGAVEQYIKPGMHVAFGGFSLCRNTMAVSHEIIRKNIGNLHISSVNPAYSADILIGAGLVKSVESGCLNMERLGLPRNFCRAVEKGTLKSEDYEHGTMTFRYLAGSLGLPFIPTKALLGSDIPKYQSIEGRMKSVESTCPFSNEKVMLVPACLPEVAVIHVTRADENGNCQIDGSAFADEFIAKASKTVVIIADEIVSEDEIRSNPKSTVIPGYIVNAVVHCSWGAYPSAVPGRYDYDYDGLRAYQKACASPETFKEYLDKYVFGVKNWEEYLEIAGTPLTYRRLEIDPRLGYSAYTAELVGGGKQAEPKEPGEYNLRELMIVAAARELKNGEVIVAGTGLPMAAATVAKLAHAPDLNYIVETGIGDVRPKHSALSVADPRLSGAAKPSFIANTLEGLGHLVHKGRADVGFLGGAQIDMYGNLNATFLGSDYFHPKKRFPGSGGANVIASCAKRILTIMKHEKRRFLNKVDYITSPGHLDGGETRSKAGLTGGGPDRVITDLAILGFDEVSKRMKLISIHPGVTVQQVCDETSFELIVPDNIEITSPPTEEELKILRANVSPIYFAD